MSDLYDVYKSKMRDLGEANQTVSRIPEFLKKLQDNPNSVPDIVNLDRLSRAEATIAYLWVREEKYNEVLPMILSLMAATQKEVEALKDNYPLTAEDRAAIQDASKKLVELDNKVAELNQRPPFVKVVNTINQNAEAQQAPPQKSNQLMDMLKPAIIEVLKVILLAAAGAYLGVNIGTP